MLQVEFNQKSQISESETNNLKSNSIELKTNRFQLFHIKRIPNKTEESIRNESAYNDWGLPERSLWTRDLVRENAREGERDEGRNEAYDQRVISKAENQEIRGNK